MIVFKSINKLNKEVNFKANIGFVPTMGALHKGHISLINSCKKKCKKTLVSIFINPSQFNKKSDFHSYPRNLKKDIKILKKLKVDYLLIPNVREIYRNKKSMQIKLKKKDKILCAFYRPGHFEGVLAVIDQFLKKMKIKYIFLGEKDYQQIFLIRKFIKNKHNVEIISCKTLRTNKLLPFSSRNSLLSKNNIKKASLISLHLYKFYHSLKKNITNKSRLKIIKQKIESQNVKIEYFDLRNKNNFSKNFNKYNFKIFISYYINKVRLIDNF